MSYIFLKIPLVGMKCLASKMFALNECVCIFISGHDLQDLGIMYHTEFPVEFFYVPSYSSFLEKYLSLRFCKVWCITIGRIHCYIHLNICMNYMIMILTEILNNKNTTNGYPTNYIGQSWKRFLMAKNRRNSTEWNTSVP